MRIVIVGAGKVGNTVASQLDREGHGITLIEKNELILEKALADIDVAGICGDGVDSRVLQEAGIGQTDLFLALSGNDEQNLLSCFIAKKLGAENTIARIRRPEYNNITQLIKDDMGLSMSVNPEKEAALDIARILELPLAKKVETFAQGKVEMIDCEVGADSPMGGKLVKDVFADMKSALVCAVERGGEVSIPLGDFRFQQGDVMTVIAPAGKMWEFFKEAGLRQHSIRRVIISGGGRTCYYLAKHLLSQRIKVTVIERDEKVAERLAEQLPNAEIFAGDGTSQNVLLERGLATADAFCCLTGIDEENILTSVYAKSVSPRIKTITKINRVELMPIVKPLGIGSVVSPKLIAADQVVRYVRAKQNGVGSGMLTLYRIVDNKAEALEFEVGQDSVLVGVPISGLNLKDDVILACINRQGSVFSPRGDDCLQTGDLVVVVTTHPGFDELEDIIKG